MARCEVVDVSKFHAPTDCGDYKSTFVNIVTDSHDILIRQNPKPIYNNYYLENMDLFIDG